MMHQIASKVPQISKNFSEGGGGTAPPQDGDPKQGSPPYRTASYAYELIYELHNFVHFSRPSHKARFEWIKLWNLKRGS